MYVISALCIGDHRQWLAAYRCAVRIKHGTCYGAEIAEVVFEGGGRDDDVVAVGDSCEDGLEEDVHLALDVCVGVFESHDRAIQGVLAFVGDDGECPAGIGVSR